MIGPESFLATRQLPVTSQRAWSVANDWGHLTQNEYLLQSAEWNWAYYNDDN